MSHVAAHVLRQAERHTFGWSRTCVLNYYFAWSLVGVQPVQSPSGSAFPVASSVRLRMFAFARLRSTHECRRRSVSTAIILTEKFPEALEDNVLSQVRRVKRPD
eukprot:6201613-Pleurochrysis_carterae.AAC.3